MHSYCDVWYTTPPDIYFHDEAPSYDDEDESCANCGCDIGEATVEGGKVFCCKVCADDYFCQGD